MADVEVSLDAGERPAWLREAPFWALVLLVLPTYFHRLGARVVRHEEPHRGQVAVEMMASGDWIVPREQGLPLLSRPPVHNWLIAGVVKLSDRLDAHAIRLPSALSVLATVLLLYAYSRRFLGQLGAFAAGAAYATMGQVLEMGTKGETEALFTLEVTISLLVWHAAAARGPISTARWVLAYAFVAVGTLTKGPQAPIYFAGGVGLYLLWRRRWRELLRPGQWIGLAVYVALVCLWLVPFWRTMGFAKVLKIFFGDVGYRFDESSLLGVIAHLATYPVDVLGSILPWSVLLFAYASRRFRARLGRFSDAALFLWLCIAVSFPSCWFPPGSKPRYYMPLYPCMAVLIGAVVERSASVADEGWTRIWHGLRRTLGVVSGLAGVALLGAKLLGPEDWVAGQTLGFVIVFAAASLACAALLLGPGPPPRRAGERRVGAAVAAATAWIGLAFAGVAMNHWIATSGDVAQEVEALRARLPAGVRVYSIGYVDPVFVHYWGEPVALVFWDPEGVFSVPPEVEYFTFTPDYGGGTIESIRFDYELIATIDCDHTPHETPFRVVYVGRVIR